MRILSKSTVVFAALLFLLPLFYSPYALGGSYPKDGVFKRLPESRDAWYYVDNNNWDIKAPDKWTHMMGSMTSSMLLGKAINNKYAAGAMVLAFGLYKEYDDGYREGWSYRDIIADALGVTSSLFTNEKVSLLADYGTDRVIFKFSYTF